MTKHRIVVLKYVDGSTSETEVTPKIPVDVRVDVHTEHWWLIGSSWCGRIQVGKHLLHVPGDKGLINVNLGVPGAVIGVYDANDQKQVRAMEKDTAEALKERKEQGA